MTNVSDVLLPLISPDDTNEFHSGNNISTHSAHQRSIDQVNVIAKCQQHFH